MTDLPDYEFGFVWDFEAYKSIKEKYVGKKDTQWQLRFGENGVGEMHVAVGVPNVFPLPEMPRNRRGVQRETVLAPAAPRAARVVFAKIYPFVGSVREP
jgi:hypothetical protein